MQLQHTINKNPRREMFFDLIELLTGLYLVLFLWTHMLFVSTIILGADVFNTLAHGLDEYYLAQIGIPITVMVFFLHFFVAGRRIPTRIQDQKIIWKHAKLTGHIDTWTWIFQAITGMAILVLGAIHMWVVIVQWPIDATVSAMRVQGEFLWFYIVLLLLGEYHASMGLYRQAVKWGWLRRRPVAVVLKFITIFIIGLGLVALWAFLQLGGI